MIAYKTVKCVKAVNLIDAIFGFVRMSSSMKKISLSCPLVLNLDYTEIFERRLAMFVVDTRR